MREICLVPTFRREELLYCCLKRIRAIEPGLQVEVFPDRGTSCDPLVQEICASFNTHVNLVPDSNWYGNTANTMNAYLWAYNAGFERVFYVESDVMVHSDFFSWHRTMHEEYDDIFASMAWIFNRHAPITDDLLFQPWYYSVGTAFSRKKLELIARHATPKYFEDMARYIAENFPNSRMNDPFVIAHVEQDGLIQRILDVDRSQTVTPGIAKCSHIGFTRSYGTASVGREYDDFLGEGTFEERVERVEQFIADPFWRAEIFGGAIVSRELGYELKPRVYLYRVTDGLWSSEFESEHRIVRTPTKINSATLSADAKLELVGEQS